MDDPKTMLIVYDQEIDRSLLTGIFEGEFNIISAKNRKLALDTLFKEKKSISIVLLDMSISNGQDVLREIQEDQDLRDIPVVVISTADSIKDECSALDLGAVDVILKPVEPRIAINRVQKIIQGLSYKKELEYQAGFDQLTNIYNKLSFFKITHEMLQSNRDTIYVLILWDIERFKVVNDLFGSEVGDDLLRHIGKSLKTEMRYCGTYGRLNADKFVMCFPYKKLEIDELQTTFKRRINEFPIDFELVICFGIYVIDDPDMPVNLMCDRANLAQRTVKGNYMTRYAFYSEKLRDQLIQDQEIINEMSSALESGQFCIYMQPQYDHLKNRIIGAEALVRWMHPIKGIIAPNVFIHIFEQNGFILKLDEYVWDCACRAIRSWIDRGHTPVPVSLNISRVDLYHPKFCEILLKTLEKYDVPISLINLEITESAYTENARQLVESIENLKSCGFIIQMDDFGSGYSSLNTLKDVPVDVLKLDLRFLSGETVIGRGGNILNSIVRMAEWLKLPVIAEGVETEKQADFLKKIGCSLVQGYYYSKPLPIQEFEALLLQMEHDQKTNLPYDTV